VRSRWIALAWLACGAVTAAADPLPQITRIGVGEHADYDRVVFQLDGEAAATHGREGPKLVIEIAARPSESARLPSPLPSRIASVELHETTAGTRIDFGSRPERVRVFRLSGPPRIVVDFAGPGSEPFELPAGLEPLPERASAPPKPKPPTPPEAAISPEAPECARFCAESLRQGELRDGFDLRTCIRDQCLRAARQHRERGRRGQALVALDYLMDDGGDPPKSAHWLRGVVLYELGRFPEAIESFDATLERSPSDLLARSMRAQALARSGRLEAAKAEFQALLALPAMQGRPASYMRSNLGLIELQLGEIEAGRRNLEAAAELDPSNDNAPDALEMIPYVESGALSPRGLGDILAFNEAKRTGRIEAADAALRSLSASSPDFALGYVIRAAFLTATGRERECDEMLRPAVAHFPDDVELRFASFRCTILRYGPESSQGRRAVEEARKLAAANPESELGASLLDSLEP
jgi:tetratricopeptide (TPR) repeat protein